MAANRISLTELLFMVSVYRKHHYYDRAVEILTNLINFEKRAATSDKTVLALALYNLAEIYSDQSKYRKSSPLYKEAAELWYGRSPKVPESGLWYVEALQGLQLESDRLLSLSRQLRQGEIA